MQHGTGQAGRSLEAEQPAGDLTGSPSVPAWREEEDELPSRPREWQMCSATPRWEQVGTVHPNTAGATMARAAFHGNPGCQGCVYGDPAVGLVLLAFYYFLGSRVISAHVRVCQQTQCGLPRAVCAAPKRCINAFVISTGAPPCAPKMTPVPQMSS